mmetsp:Transcript_29099/g.93856  ORF Transcript_29099/g.93856 Transcript_29099/m.93856 type:complete len:358 (-) Transcript_29099:224-1297(-)
MGKTDYYGILGVGKGATDEEIKKAYKKMALKWHPDRHASKSDAEQKKAEEQFKEVAEAFDVLSDPQKKQIYDTYGEEGLKAGPAEGGAAGGGAQSFPGGGGVRYEFRGDPREIFARFFQGGFERNRSFGEGSPFDGFDDLFAAGAGGTRMEGARVGGGGVPGGFGRGGVAPNKRPSVVVKNLHCTLEELYRGATKRLKITRKSRTMQRDTTKVLEVPVRRGFKAGTKITYPGEGDETEPGVAQDVVVVLKEKQHPLFVREGETLHYRARVDLVDALCGFKIDVTTLDEQPRVLRVSFQNVNVTPSTTKVIPGEGFPNSKNPAERGDLIVSVDVKFPRRGPLSQDHHAAVRAALASIS